MKYVTCPNCSHEFEHVDAHQQLAGKARWKGTRKRERSAAARAASLVRWGGKKRAVAGAHP